MEAATQVGSRFIYCSGQTIGEPSYKCCRELQSNPKPRLVTLKLTEEDRRVVALLLTKMASAAPVTSDVTNNLAGREWPDWLVEAPNSYFHHIMSILSVKTKGL